MKNIRYSPEGAGSTGSGAESAANDSSSTSDVNDASGTAAEATTVATTSQTTTDPTKPVRKTSDVVRERVARKEAEVMGKLATRLAEEFGIEVAEGENPLDRLVEIKERLKPAEQAVSDLDRFKREAAVASENVRKAEQRHQNYVRDTQVQMAIARHAEKLVPEAIPAMQAAFLAEYQIRSTAEGVRVYDASGQIMYTDDGDEMSAPQALEKFLEGKSFFLKAASKPAGTVQSTAGNMRGTATTAAGKVGITRADLAAGKADPKMLREGRYTITD